MNKNARVRTSIRAKEIYPFINWVMSTIIAILFTLWAFIPESLLERCCEDWMLPDRYYIIAVGNWIIVTFIYYHLMIQAVSLT